MQPVKALGNGFRPAAESRLRASFSSGLALPAPGGGGRVAQENVRHPEVSPGRAAKAHRLPVTPVPVDRRHSAIIALQRSAGNRAVAASLVSACGCGPHADGAAHSSGAATPRARSVVQRFPASVLATPTKWGGTVGKVSRPGEGISGGVYFFNSANQTDDIKRVVIKPVSGQSGLGLETAEQIQFGDRALKAFLGVSTPKSRLVGKGSAEWTELAGIIRPYQPKKPSPPHPDDKNPPRWNDIADSQGIIVMGEVPSGRSLSSMAEKGATDAKARSDLMELVFSHRFVEQLARPAPVTC